MATLQMPQASAPPSPTEVAARLAQIEADQPGLVSIIILTWNELEATRRCIDSLRESVQMPMEIIAVDNGSTDGSVEFWREQARTHLQGRAQVRTVFNVDNRGFSIGCNQGLSIASGDYILFLNNDTVVQPRAVDRLAAWLTYDPRIGLVGPRSNNIEGWAMIPGAPTEDAEAVAQFAGQWVNEHQGQGEVRLALWGYCLMSRREVLEKVGGFDPIFSPAFCEDADLNVRVWKARHLVWLAHDSFVAHEGHRSTRKIPGDIPAYIDANRRLFLRKWGGQDDEPLGDVMLRAAQVPFDSDRDFIPFVAGTQP